MASSSRVGRNGASAPRRRTGPSRTDAIVDQLRGIESAGGDGTLEFGRGRTLHVSSLGKLFFPDDGCTKGDVMRYYAAVAPALLPIVKDRPLILNRYPDGIAGPSFFQQNAGARVPDGVRTAPVETAAGGSAERLIGGDLQTILYTVQIGTIAVHTWQARAQSAESADSTTIDLDPGDDVPFRDVVLLAKDIKAILDRWELRACIKTSGSSGLHIVLPLPPDTDFERAARLAARVAESVVAEHPERATRERRIRARPRRTIYVDAEQNSAGKSVVAAYSVRERTGATVSAPLEWRELRSTLRLEAFTMRTMPSRLKRVGDLWGAAMKRRNTKRAIDRALMDA